MIRLGFFIRAAATMPSPSEPQPAITTVSLKRSSARLMVWTESVMARSAPRILASFRNRVNR